MLIPEAVQLVLCAATLPSKAGKGGGRYVLDMGEPVRLIDMARELIRLSGFIPDEEIPIRIVGLRPGEKLHEELVLPDETVDASSIEKILGVSSSAPTMNPAVLMDQVHALERAALAGDTAEAAARLHTLVPSFSPRCSDPVLLPITETSP